MMQYILIRVTGLILLIFLSACQLSPSKPGGEIAVERELSPEIIKLYQQGLHLMKIENDEAAFKVFKSVSQQDDSLSGPYVNRGLIYLRANDKNKAKAEFLGAVERNSKNATALNQLGVLSREEGDIESAKSNYQAALQADPGHANAHLNMGILCDIYLQDKPCAMKHYKSYQVLRPGDESINNWIIDLQEQL